MNSCKTARRECIEAGRKNSLTRAGLVRRLVRRHCGGCGFGGFSCRFCQWIYDRGFQEVAFLLFVLFVSACVDIFNAIRRCLDFVRKHDGVFYTRSRDIAAWTLQRETKGAR